MNEMRKAIGLAVLAAAMWAATGGVPTRAAKTASGRSGTFGLDTREGIRTAGEVETIAWGAVWENEAAGAVAEVAVDGVRLGGGTGSGEAEWRPSRDGLYELTHRVTVDGETVGEVLRAQFLYGAPFEVSVVNGTGDGSYDYAETVRIAADDREGHAFAGWNGSRADVGLLEDANCATTTFVMPARDVYFEATYEDIPGVLWVVADGGGLIEVRPAEGKERIEFTAFEANTEERRMSVVARGAIGGTGTASDEVGLLVRWSMTDSEEWAVPGVLRVDSAEQATVTADVAEWEPTLVVLGLCKDSYIVVDKDSYMVVDMEGGAEAANWPVRYLSKEPAGGWPDEYKTTKLVLRRIEAGTFTMGSPMDELGRLDNEMQHEVTLTKPFYLGVFEVTQAQWELAMGSNPSAYPGATRPVEQVSYNMIRGSSAGAGWPGSSAVDERCFLGVLRSKTGIDFDLPTEAQWEYACRAGTTTALNSGKNLTDEYECPNMAEVGRYCYNGGESSQHTTVGSYRPNAWGLYDMHGNVWEWCLDWYALSLGTAAETDPKGSPSGSSRVGRGGSWYDYAEYCRSAYRIHDGSSFRSNDAGFRLACVPGL